MCSRYRKKKIMNREKFNNKRAKTWNEFGKQKSNVKRSSFRQKPKGPAPSSASAPAPKNKGEYYRQNSMVKPEYSQGSVVQGGSKPPEYESVVETTLVFVVRTPLVVSSAVISGISGESVQRISRKMVVGK